MPPWRKPATWLGPLPNSRSLTVSTNWPSKQMNTTNTRMMPTYYCKRAFSVFSSASLTRATRARVCRSSLMRMAIILSHLWSQQTQSKPDLYQRSKEKSWEAHSIGRQNCPPLHHRTSGGTGGSRPTECHQSIGHRHQRRCGPSHHQVSWKQRHQCHPLVCELQQKQSIDKFALYKVMKLAIDGAYQPSTNDTLEQQS